MTKKALAEILASQRQQRKMIRIAGSKARPRPGFASSALILFSMVTAAFLIYRTENSATREIRRFQASHPFPVMVQTEAAPSIAPSQHMVCTGLDQGVLHVRKHAGATSEVLGYLSEGDKVEANDGIALLFVERSEWMHISTPIEGWVNTRYLCPGDQ